MLFRHRTELETHAREEHIHPLVEPDDPVPEGDDEFWRLVRHRKRPFPRWSDVT
jgi:hypothetical protein